MHGIKQVGPREGAKSPAKAALAHSRRLRDVISRGPIGSQSDSALNDTEAQRSLPPKGARKSCSTGLVGERFTMRQQRFSNSGRGTLPNHPRRAMEILSIKPRIQGSQPDDSKMRGGISEAASTPSLEAPRGHTKSRASLHAPISRPRRNGAPCAAQESLPRTYRPAK